jgi:hypothetical protein
MPLTAVVGGKALWFLTRGTGVMALLLLTASMVLGILEVKRWHSPRWPRFVTAGLHRYVSLLSVAFVGVHVATTVVDGFAPIGWLDAVVPFRSPYRPLWLGLGAVGLDLLIALVVTSLVRGRIGYRTWRVVHWAGYACWPVSLVHGLGTGTDVPQAWSLALTGACLVAVVGAVWWRLADALTAGPRDSAAGAAGGAGAAARVMVPGALLSVVLPVAIVAWLLSGPLQPGWARRAGTPKSVLRPAAAAGSIPSGAAANPEPTTLPPTPFSLPATAEVSGTRTETTDPDGQATVTFDTTLTDPASARLLILLHGTALAAGGLALRTSQVTLGIPPGAPAYQGTVTALRGSRLTLALVGPSGEQVVEALRLVIAAGGAVTGTMTRQGP